MPPAFWGWLFWDQVPDVLSVAGSVLVIAGGLMTILRTRGRPGKN